jgi:hypothetical protein
MMNGLRSRSWVFGISLLKFLKKDLGRTGQREAFFGTPD